jgi:hypothetical protein
MRETHEQAPRRSHTLPPHIREFLDALAIIIAEDLMRRSRERTTDSEPRH